VLVIWPPPRVALLVIGRTRGAVDVAFHAARLAWMLPPASARARIMRRCAR